MEVNDGWVLGVCDPVNCDYPLKIIYLFPTGLNSIYFPA